MTRFRDEFAIISPVAKVIALVVALGAAAAVALIFAYMSKSGNPPVWMRVPSTWLLIFVPCLIGGWGLLVGYVNADAKRRGMNSLLWTLLAALVPNAIGFILFFLLREPLMRICHHCGAKVQPGFAFCPHCGAALSPACRACRRPVEPGWANCPYCGAAL